MQIILAREYLKDVSISREQLKYLVMEAVRGGCQVLNTKLFLISQNIYIYIYKYWVGGWWGGWWRAE